MESNESAVHAVQRSNAHRRGQVSEGKVEIVMVLDANPVAVESADGTLSVCAATAEEVAELATVHAPCLPHIARRITRKGS